MLKDMLETVSLFSCTNKFINCIRKVWLILSIYTAVFVVFLPRSISVEKSVNRETEMLGYFLAHAKAIIK